jgi:branched-subunit amino acid transport protein
MNPNVYLYIIVMAVVTYLVRVLPLTLIRKEIKNKTIRSFLYYVPYVTLAVMTFPAMLYATGTIWSGVAALIVAMVVAFRGAGLMQVALSACVAVFLLELFLC